MRSFGREPGTNRNATTIRDKQSIMEVVTSRKFAPFEYLYLVALWYDAPKCSWSVRSDHTQIVDATGKPSINLNRPD